MADVIPSDNPLVPARSTSYTFRTWNYGYVCETPSGRIALAFTLSISAPNGLLEHEL